MENGFNRQKILNDKAIYDVIFGRSAFSFEGDSLYSSELQYTNITKNILIYRSSVQVIFVGLLLF